jgi:hypothetical protein
MLVVFPIGTDPLPVGLVNSLGRLTFRLNY